MVLLFFFLPLRESFIGRRARKMTLEFILRITIVNLVI